MALFKSLRHSSNFVEVHPIHVPMFHNFVSTKLCLGKTVSAKLCLAKTCLCYDLKVNINLHFKYSSRCKNNKSRRDNIIDHGLPRLAPLKPTKKLKTSCLRMRISIISAETGQLVPCVGFALSRADTLIRIRPRGLIL